MKMLCSSGNEAEIGLLKGMLEEAGVKCEIRNEITHSNFPGGEFYPELWILDEGDFPKATELFRTWRETPAGETGAWKCSVCGEVSEGQFVSCWKCGTKHNDNTEPIAPGNSG